SQLYGRSHCHTEDSTRHAKMAQGAGAAGDLHGFMCPEGPRNICVPMEQVCGGQRILQGQLHAHCLHARCGTARAPVATVVVTAPERVAEPLRRSLRNSSTEPSVS